MTIRAPAESTQRLLKAARDALRPPGLFRAAGNPRMALEGIVASGDVGAVSELLSIALEHAGPPRAGCVEAAWALAAPLPPGGLPELDEWLRRAGPWSGFWEGAWKRLTPREVTALRGDSLPPGSGKRLGAGDPTAGPFRASGPNHAGQRGAAPAPLTPAGPPCEGNEGGPPGYRRGGRGRASIRAGPACAARGTWFDRLSDTSPVLPPGCARARRDALVARYGRPRSCCCGPSMGRTARPRSLRARRSGSVLRARGGGSICADSPYRLGVLETPGRADGRPARRGVPVQIGRAAWRDRV